MTTKANTTTASSEMKLTKLRRKEIALSFVDRALALYPDWSKPAYNLPTPINPPKLAAVDLSKKQMALLPLGEIQKAVLCGTICSDSSFTIHNGYKNARLQARHSTRQFTWFLWKYRVILKEFTNDSSIVFQESDGYQLASQLKPSERFMQACINQTVLGKLKVATLAKPKLTALHGLICVNNKKAIQRYWLNHMNNYFLMTIWLDDGSLYNGYQGIICFNSIPMDQQQVFRDYLLSVWEIETTMQHTGLVMKNGQKNYRIAISNAESLLKLLTLVAPVLPVREMLYKVCYVPKNNKSLLQRWRTELAGLVRPEFKAEINQFYDQVEKYYHKQNS